MINNTTPRIALIHALTHSIAPINEAFSALWPQARLMHLLDDSLSADLATSEKGLDADMHQRFQTLADYVVAQGCHAILFTCSAFGSCIEAVAQSYSHMPVLKPNEAMIREACANSSARIGLIASFAPTLASMPAEFPSNTILKTALAAGALDALNQGNSQLHDELVTTAAQQLAQQGCNIIALSQFSMARATQAVQDATQLPVLSTPHSAVRLLHQYFNSDI